MRIVVTGGSGNVGISVTKRLIEAKHEVIVLDKRPPRCDGAKFVYLDLRNREVLQPAVEGADAVIHLGELSNAGAGESPQQVYATNCAIGSTVMQTAADLKVSRFIYTSTCQVYGQWGGDLEGMRLPLDQFPMTESQAHRPQNPYGLSKSSNERFAEWVSRETGMPVAIFRLPYVLSARSAERWVRWCNDSSYDYQHRPDGFWTFVHAEDVAEGFLQAVESPQTGCEAYHLFAEDIVGKPSLRERAGAMGLANLALPVDWPAQASPTTSAKAREHFGWRPKHSWASLSASFDGV